MVVRASGKRHREEFAGFGRSIGVESEVGKGSTFTVKIPAEYREPT